MYDIRTQSNTVIPFYIVAPSAVEADLAGFSHDRSAIFRLVHRNAQQEEKKHRRACVHQTTLDSKYGARKEHT